MNRIFSLHFHFLILLLLSISSCSKANKKKISDNWTISEYERTFKEQLSGGSTYYQSITISGKFLTNIEEIDNGIQSSYSNKTATVSENTFAINEDGTWIRKLIYKENLSSTAQVQTMESSGTWKLGNSGKGANSSKNSRLNLTVLKEVHASHGSAAPTNETYTYSDGEFLISYAILELKKGTLRLKLESNSMYPNENWSPYTLTEEMTLGN